MSVRGPPAGGQCGAPVEISLHHTSVVRAATWQRDPAEGPGSGGFPPGGIQGAVRHPGELRVPPV